MKSFLFISVDNYYFEIALNVNFGIFLSILNHHALRNLNVCNSLG